VQECTYFSKKKTSISIDTIIKNEFSPCVMKRSKRINRNLAVVGIMILGFLVYVFGGDMMGITSSP
jgi:hypothetical protein